MPKIPSSLQGVVWSRDINSLNLEKDKDYVIHQVLAYGTFKQIKWLKSVYSEDEIRKVFEVSPKKAYTPSQFNFVKNYILSIDKNLPSENYVKSTPRNIR